MMLCSSGGYGGHRFLFELLPDLFPHPYFTELEFRLWARHYNRKKKGTKDGG